jgi:potassium channel subfamily K
MTRHPTVPALATEAETDMASPPTQTSLTRRLALSIQKVSLDLKTDDKRYTYEEWVEFTRLIRLTSPERLDRDLGNDTTASEDENEEGLVNWDWIGDDSPMVSGISESEWLMKRLIESLVRLERRKEVARRRPDVDALREMECGRSVGGQRDSTES